jgi:hypothetical protein
LSRRPSPIDAFDARRGETGPDQPTSAPRRRSINHRIIGVKISCMRQLRVRLGLQPALGGGPAAPERGGNHLDPELALAVRAGTGRDPRGQGTLDRSDGVQELRLQGGCGGDQGERVAVGFSLIGVLLDERTDNRMLEGLVDGTRAQRCRDTRSPFRREPDHDRLLAAGEVVVVSARRHPGGLGDIVDPNVLRSVFEGQAQRGGAEGLPGGKLLALPHPTVVAGAHTPQPTEICAHA